MLRYTGDDERVDEAPRPIPFPREKARRRARAESQRDTRRAGDAAWMAERAIDRVQSQLDELDRLIGEPLPFPGRDDPDDDGPSAA